MVGGVRVGRLAGHEVDEGLEGDDAHPVGIHDAHDAGELVLTLVATERNCDPESPWLPIPTATKTHGNALYSTDRDLTWEIST